MSKVQLISKSGNIRDTELLIDGHSIPCKTISIPTLTATDDRIVITAEIYIDELDITMPTATLTITPDP